MTDDTITLAVPNMQNWNTDQVLAVYDLCQMISATLMARHHDELVEKMIELDRQRGFQHHVPVKDVDPNLQLPFDDPWPL